MILVSPTEPKSIRTALGLREIEWMVSGKSERLGVDFCWRAGERWYGVQRKTCDDFLASCEDGRLAREIGQMRAGVVLPIVFMEGTVNKYAGRVTRGQFNKRMMSLMHAGCGVWRTRDINETADCIRDYWQWSHAESHSTAVLVPKAANNWGTPTNDDWQAAVLMQLPGVGGMTARRIVRALGMPLKFTASKEELMNVMGVGEKTADRILEVFGEKEHDGQVPGD